MNNRLGKAAIVISAIALLLSLATFLKTGGIGDIKQQVSILKKDLMKVREQSEKRVENCSMLFESIYDLSDSIDSLQAGKEAAARKLIAGALESIESVEPRLEERKRKQLENLRMEIEERTASLRKGDEKGIQEFRYQIRLLRIFEENL